MNTKQIAQFLYIVAWIIFLGACVQAGALLFNILFAEFVNPEALHNMYDGLNLYPLHQYNVLYYWHISISLLIIFILQAWFGWHLVTLGKVLDINKPFTEAVATQIMILGKTAVGISVAAYITNAFAKWLNKFVPVLATVKSHNPASSEMLVLAAVLFVVAYIFKRGIALQTENELTV